MNIGIIGTGNMGTIVIEALVESKAADPEKLIIQNRTKLKAEGVAQIYPGITVAESPDEVASKADIVFICVKPLDIHPLLKEISHQLSHEKCIVSITSPISVSELESVVDCSVARIIPSITNRSLSGSTLITFGENCSVWYQNTLHSLVSKFSKPVYIEEDTTRIASDIAACAPAFFSYLIQRFIDAAVEETEINKEDATTLASNMLVGMGKLLEKEIYTLPTLQEKVCVKGGVTGEGIKALDAEVGQLFNHLIRATHNKYDEDRKKVTKQFNTFT